MVKVRQRKLAKLTNGSNVAIVQMGATLPTSNPPIRVAEEYAILDCISGGRLVAGLPLGSPMDVNFCYGITPMEHRERYREAFALTLKAWQAREIFAWNGRYYQLAEVNLWPRPIQQPHPPVWVPGSGSISTELCGLALDVPSGISPPPRCPVQPRPDPRLRLILAHLEHTTSCLDAVTGASPGYERARERCITEVGMLRTSSRA